MGWPTPGLEPNDAVHRTHCWQCDRVADNLQIGVGEVHV